MPDIPLYNGSGEQIGSLPLPEAIFGVEVNEALVHQAVVTEEANARQGTAETKTRGHVSGGGKKPYRQKGTGRARQGTTRAPHWRHGGVVFGPHPRSYTKALPTKMRRGAMRSALSAKVACGDVIALDALSIEDGKTREVVAVLNRLPLTQEKKTKHYEEGGLVRGTKQVPARVLLVVPAYDRRLYLSCRNVPYLTLRYAPSFSVRDVAVAGRVVLIPDAVARIEEVLAR